MLAVAVVNVGAVPVIFTVLNAIHDRIVDRGNGEICRELTVRNGDRYRNGASVVSLLAKVTTKSPVGSPFRVTVPVAVPPFSLMLILSILMESLGISRFQAVLLFKL